MTGHNDFSDYPISYRSYGGSDRKFGIIMDGQYYMLKFPERHDKKDEMTTSYLNKPTSEYISSHISNSAGVPAHDTILGEYKGEITVACKDFRGEGEQNLSFRNVCQSIYDNVKKTPYLYQIYETIRESPMIPDELRNMAIRQYWDTFVVDALVGNFDRHNENWGFVAGKTLRIAPAYDFGSTLFPQLSDEGISEIINDDYELLRRCFVFPSPALYLTKEKTGKPGYYDMMVSGYDDNCTDAILRIVPNINMDNISNIIDDTPYITDIKKEFYKKILCIRKTLILDTAYDRCLNRNFDDDAYLRVVRGQSFTDGLLKMRMRDIHIEDLCEEGDRE